MKQIADTKKHAEFSASGSPRWLNCPGSIALSRDCPKLPETKWAKEGTEAHACLEFLLQNRRQFEKALSMARRDYPLDMIEHCERTARMIIDHLDENPDAEFFCETRVDASSFTCKGQFGTVDAAIALLFDRLIVIDYKYGAGYAVDPEGEDGKGHSQLVYYALGIAEQFNFNFETVELVVIQPRAYHESGETVRSYTMTIRELLEWKPRFQVMVQIANEAKELSDDESIEDYLKKGDWCRWCPAAFKCPELKQKAMDRAKIVFSDDTGLESVPEPKLAKAPDLSKMLQACDDLEIWIKKVREHAYHVLAKGGDIKGYKLVKKTARRKWVTDAYEKLKELGYEDFHLFEDKFLSPSEFEKQFPKNEPGLKKMMQRLTTKESSGLSLVDESDKRPAVRRLDEIFDAEIVEDPT